MQLVLVLALLAALAISEQAPHQAAGHAAIRTVAALGTMLAAPLFAAFASWLTARRLTVGGRSGQAALAWYGRLRTLHVAIWLLSAGGVLYLLGWPQLVRFNWRLDGVPLLDDVLILLPLVAPLVLSWAAFYEVDRSLRMASTAPLEAAPADGEMATCRLAGVAEAAIHGPSHSPGLPGVSRAAYVGLHLRSLLGIVLVPLLLLATIQDLVRLAAPRFAEGPFAWTVFIPPLVLLLVFFPLLLRRLWRAVPLGSGPLRERLEAAARRWGLAVRQILVWHTDGQLVNAAVAGFLPHLRYVFLSDALLTNLTAAEIEAVFGHEAGHIRHHHVFLRSMVILAPLGGWSLAKAVVPGLIDRASAGLAAAGFASSEQTALLALAGVGLYVAAVFGYFSRRLERQADLCGCQAASAALLEPLPADTAAEAGRLTPEGVRVFISALEKLALLNGINRRAPGWQHDSIAQRVAFLEAVAQDPRRARRLDRQVRLLGSLVVGVVVAGLTWPLVVRLSAVVMS